MANPVQHQLYQPFPKLDSPLVGANGQPSIPWYYLLLALWRRTGGSVVPSTSAILFDTSAGAPESVQGLSSSPFTFTAPLVGFLTADGGKVELSRSGTWREVSLVGGSFWLMAGDSVRVSWFGQGPPEVIWWPSK